MTTALNQRFVGQSSAIAKVRHLIEQVASKDATVLILGESGTGKEMVAKAVHEHSSRAHGPFVAVNCTAIPAELLESELFGHEKGAFTGAHAVRVGRFEQAEGGSLFLDEIGDMPMTMQVKLLRVLQERIYERVGGNQSHTADVRILAATNCDLELKIQQGLFREDLFYRLNVFPVHLPTLKERREDIPALVNDLLTLFKEEGEAPVQFSPEAMDLLCAHTWPGNIRELSNLLERLAILYPGKSILPEDLPEKFGLVPADSPLMSDEFQTVIRSFPTAGFSLKKYLQDLEIHFILQALNLSSGVVQHAADLLKMRRTTLVEKMRKYKITRQGIDANDEQNLSQAE
jgi:sigma-54 specific flagellar transcriptional regulator A